MSELLDNNRLQSNKHPWCHKQWNVKIKEHFFSNNGFNLYIFLSLRIWHTSKLPLWALGTIMNNNRPGTLFGGNTVTKTVKSKSKAVVI